MVYRHMVEKTVFRWPPQPSTVVGIGVLAGSLCYLVTGDPVWAGIAAAAVKILVPDNSTLGDRALEAVEILAQAVRRSLQVSAQQAHATWRDREPNAGSLSQEAEQ